MNGQHQNDPVDAVEDVDGRLYYRILGVVETASTADIKKAFHRLARKLHPDKGGDPASFARLLEAFETLHDPRKRRVYDSLASKLR